MHVSEMKAVLKALQLPLLSYPSTAVVYGFHGACALRCLFTCITLSSLLHGEPCEAGNLLFFSSLTGYEH